MTKKAKKKITEYLLIVNLKGTLDLSHAIFQEKVRKFFLVRISVIHQWLTMS